MKSFEERVFKDPIHSFIRVTDQLIWDLIQTSAFQRLRRIKQLGGTHIVYPTAEHSRFSHSLGVYFIARKMLTELSKQGYEFSEHDRMLLLTSALLHDVGHGPFSHAFEDVLEISHEYFSRRIIEEDGQVAAILENFKRGFSKEVSAVIGKTHPNHLIVSMISSHIDADRLDYLLRDAYFTGTTYGEFDLDRILRTMRVVDNEIAFKLSGMHALEDYLFSRYQMYWQVYLHDNSLSFNFLIRALLERVKYLLKTGYEFAYDMRYFKMLFLVEQIDIDIYLKFDDGVITTFASFFVDEVDEILADLAYKFLNRGLHKEFEYTLTEDFEENYEKLRMAIIEGGVEADYYLFNIHHEQSTYDYYGAESDHIDLITHNNQLAEISSVSNIIQGIVNAPKEKNTIFIDMERLKKSHNKLKILQALIMIIGKDIQ